MWVKEEEQHEPDRDEEEEDDPELMEASLVTHAAEELRMCLGLDIVLRRSAAEARNPPPPPWYETMDLDLDLPPAPPLLEGLIGLNWTGPLPSEQP